MFTKIKEIRINELYLEIENLLKKENRQKELNQLEDITYEHYNIFEKVFKRKEYLEYNAKIKILHDKVKQITEDSDENLQMVTLEQENSLRAKFLKLFKSKREKNEEKRMIEEKKIRLLKEKQKLNETSNERHIEIEKIYNEYEKMMSAENFSDLDISFEEAVSLLHERNKPVVLESADNIGNPERDYKGLQDFVLVHRTDRMPKNNRLKSVAEEQIGMMKYPFNGKIYEIPRRGEKNSIQYVMNNEIQTGSWLDCKYTVIIPFTEVPSKLIGGVSPGNTYTISGVDLTQKCYILCKEGEAEELRRQNSKLALNNIIECEGNNISGASNILIKLLGYRVEETKSEMDYDSWKDQKSERIMKEIMEKNGFKYKGYTEEYVEEENAIRGINCKADLYLGIKNYGLVKNENDVNNIFQQLNGLSYTEEELKYINILWENLEREDINIEPSKRKIITNIISMNEKQLEKELKDENDSRNEEEIKIFEFVKERLKELEIKEDISIDHLILKHIRNDLINRAVLDEIALNREREGLKE